MNIRRIRSINRFVYIGIVIIALCIIYLFPPDYSESSVYFPDSKFWLNLSMICNEASSFVQPIPLDTQESCNKNWATNSSTPLFGAIDENFVQYILSLLNDTFYPGVDLYTSYKIAQMGLKALVDVKPFEPEFGHVINDVTSWRYIIEPRTCEQHLTDKTVTGKRNVFIGIVTAPGNFERRNVIRQTWFRHLRDAHYHRGLMDVVGFTFYMGTPTDNITQSQIEEEAKVNNDILQIDMVDDYYQLARKATAFFYWAVNNCSEIKMDFIHKIDDDVYVNIRLLASTVAQLSPDENFFMGNVVDGFFGPPRGKHKTSATVQEWPWKYYPKFLKGASIIFPFKLLPLILAATQTIPYYRFDDLYLTGLCKEKIKMKLRHSAMFYSGYQGWWNNITVEGPDSCYVSKKVTWLTYFGHQMETSHAVVEGYYNNILQCFLYSNPSHYVDHLIPTNPDDSLEIQYIIN